VASPGVRGWGSKVKRVWGTEVPSGVQGRSPGLGAKLPEAENTT